MNQNAISSYGNNCALIALKFVSGRSDEEVIRVCLNRGFKNHGMYNHEILRAAMDLGVQYKDMNPKNFEIPNPKNYWNKKSTFITLSEFIRRYPVGTFMVFVNGHVFVVQNSKIYDPNMRGPGTKRRVTKVLIIENCNNKIEENINAFNRDRVPGNKPAMKVFVNGQQIPYEQFKHSMKL